MMSERERLDPRKLSLKELVAVGGRLTLESALWVGGLVVALVTGAWA